MRLNIHDQFIVGVVRPNGGWSKGRPIAYIEEEDKCVPLFDLLIPNDLDDERVIQYVGDKFSAFVPAGRRDTPPARRPTRAPERHERATKRRAWRTALSAFDGSAEIQPLPPAALPRHKVVSNHAPRQRPVAD
jgi:trehalose-6-phosphatase